MANVLVTGGAGYIGDSAVQYLLKMGHRVTILDNLMYGGAYMREHANLEFVRGDITDGDLLEELLPGHDAVLHLAAIVGDGACASNPERTLAVNQVATARIARICTRLGIRMVFSSTCSVYGAARGSLSEISPTNPQSLYAGTKLNAEEFVRLVPKHYIFRLGTLFGLSTEHARLRCDLVANILTYKAMSGQQLTVFGGEQWRPLLHVRDAGELMAMAAVRGAEAKTGGPFGTYILARQNSTILDLAYTIMGVCGIPRKKLTVTEMPFEDQRNYRVASTRAGKFWITRFSLADGINQMAKVVRQGRIADLWNKSHHNAKFVREMSDA